MSPLLKPTWTRVFLPLLTLGFPLGVLLMILLRLPIEEVDVASTDTRLLRGFSTFWCGWQEVTSSHPFYAYKVPEAPKVVREELNINSLAFRFTLAKGRDHYLRYHLLEGSTIEASGCAGEHAATLDIVHSLDPPSGCWSPSGPRMRSHSMGHPLQPSARRDQEVEYEEDDLSLSSSSSSEENSSSEEERHNPCPDSLLSSPISVSNERSDQDYPSCPSRFRSWVNVTREGVYYVVTRGGRATSFNHVLLHVRLNRTTYQLPDNMILCRSQNTCEIPLTFGTQEKVVVFVSAEPDAGSVLFPVRSKCKPRLVFYVAVFIIFPLLFAVALTTAIRQARRRTPTLPPFSLDEDPACSQQLSTDPVPAGIAGPDHPLANAPLLEAMVTPDGSVKSLVRRDSLPPPYPDLPPTYARAMASLDR